jgi:hypothetical protein
MSSFDDLGNSITELRLESAPRSIAKPAKDSQIPMNSLYFSYTNPTNSSAPRSPTMVSPNLTEQPEPQILATSAGNDSNGTLITSTSNISLLSLNHEFPVLMNSPKIIPNTSFILDRKNSHASQQRIQHYQKFAPSNVEFSASVPINVPPDSPNLVPTSVGGSPSRFWLSNQTPPRSINDVTKVIPSLFTGPKSKRVGSPILNPVQTQDPPMTPLYLSEDNDSYFGNRKDSDDSLQMTID